MSCKHLYTSNYGEYYCETNGRFRKINETSMGEPADCVIIILLVDVICNFRYLAK